MPSSTRTPNTAERRGKRRLDQLLVERGLAPSRERARAFILAREVLVDGQVALRAAAPTVEDAEIALKENARFVSRGGDKLVYALERTGVTVEGRRCLDIGASTGGFTDCLLQYGAAHVTSVDVGYGQIALRLREDPRVEVVERTNARVLDLLELPAALLVMDVSFISITTVLPAVLYSLEPGADLLILVKPQFEAGREQVEKGGVVRDPEVHARTVGRVASWANDHDLRVRGVVRSPLTGPAGNREFFLWLRMPQNRNR
jgi:23S rRNA (cytidine1920-2'-O)/16S rRNA (cytidine1409-2'-O)-methyltransferase